MGGVTDEAEREKGTQEGRKAETRDLGSQTPPKAVNNGLVPKNVVIFNVVICNICVV